MTLPPPSPLDAPLSPRRRRELLAAEPAQVYKADQRSRVWRVDAPDGAWVVKRYEFAPWRQTLLALWGIHPLQREWRWTRRLARLGVRAAPIAAIGFERRGLGWRGYSLSRFAGPSLLRRLRNGDLASLGARRRAAGAVGDLIAALRAQGLFFRDLKSSNLLLDDQGLAWLVDVGAVRRRRGAASVRRMLALLYQTARLDGATRTDALRCLQHLQDKRDVRYFLYPPKKGT